MINKIFFDADETSLHTALQEPNQKHIRFTLEEGGIYYTMIRPCMKRVFDSARNLIGVENVFILTAATRSYIQEINRLAEWGFEDHQLISREEISNHHFATAYGGTATLASKYSHIDNVLIDNLDPRYNEDKVSFLGIWRSIDTNYFKVQDYYGVNFPDDLFEKNIIHFLEERHSAPSLCKLKSEENMEV